MLHYFKKNKPILNLTKFKNDIGIYITTLILMRNNKYL